MNPAPYICRGRIALGFHRSDPLAALCPLSSAHPLLPADRQTPPEGASNVTAISSVLLRAYRVLELQMNHLFQMHARMRSLLVREKDIERSSTSFAFNTFLAEIGSQLPSNDRSSGPHAKNQAQRRKHQTSSRLLQSQYFTISWG